MKFSGKTWFMIILKVTKKQRLTHSLSRNHIFGKRLAWGWVGGGQVEPHPSLFRVNLSEVDY